jgi:hypothetical protein
MSRHFNPPEQLADLIQRHDGVPPVAYAFVADPTGDLAYIEVPACWTHPNPVQEATIMLTRAWGPAERAERLCEVAVVWPVQWVDTSDHDRPAMPADGPDPEWMREQFEAGLAAGTARRGVLMFVASPTGIEFHRTELTADGVWASAVQMPPHEVVLYDEHTLLLQSCVVDAETARTTPHHQTVDGAGREQ